MSVNISVNGKFTQHCKRRSVLEDAEKVKKELEAERRKIRLLNVRAQSKNLAKKIRSDVAAEQEKQLRKLEEIKAQELNCWREHVLLQKNHDYRSAIFQVGEAHRAAQQETESRANEEFEREKKLRDLRKKIKERRTKEALEKRERDAKENQGKTPRNKVVIPANSRSPSPGKSPDSEIKRKRNRHDSICSCCSCDEKKSCLTLSDTGDTDASYATDTGVETSPTSKKTKSKTKTRTRTRIVSSGGESDNETNECRPPTKCSPAKISKVSDPRDKRKSTMDKRQNLQRTVQLKSVAKTPVKPTTKRGAPPLTKPQRPTKSVLKKTIPIPVEESIKPNTARSRSTTRARELDATQRAARSRPATRSLSPTKTSKRELEPTADDGTTRDQSPSPPPSPTNERSKSPVIKRAVFTQISQLLQRRTEQTRMPPQDNEIPTIDLTKTPPRSPSKKGHSKTTPTSSPKKSDQSTVVAPIGSQKQISQTEPASSPRKSPVKEIATQTAFKSATKITIRSDSSHHKSGKSTVSGAASVSATGTGSGSGNRTITGRVQYFDYRNKFVKNYEQLGNAVQLHTEDPNVPNAMQQAAIENQQQQVRQKGLEIMKAKSNIRGQLAIEKEQVRREALELTEKLDALTRQHPQLIPTDTNLKRGYQFANTAARKEAKMNSAIEEILMRPAVITCPEVISDEDFYTQRSVYPDSTREDHLLNLGETNRQQGEHSSDSCCSILLERVDDQDRQVRSALNQYEMNPNFNRQRAEQLKKLLERIDQLRAILINEVRNGTLSQNNGNVNEVMQSLDKLRKEREKIMNYRQEGNVRGMPQQSSSGEYFKPNQRSLPKKKKQKKTKPNEGEEQEEEAEYYDEEVFDDDEEHEEEPQLTLRPSTKENQLNRIEISTARGKKQIVRSKKPVEIVIKVQSERKSGKSEDKKGSQAKDSLKPQYSYDSNSTSYLSLGNVEQNVDEGRKSGKQLTKGQEQSSSSGEVEVEITGDKVKTRMTNNLNPVIAQYVNKLLKMSRASVEALGISSSDMETPAASIVNVDKNMTIKLTPQQERQVERVQKIISENRGLLKDLEDSIRANQHLTPEECMRQFEEKWKNQLSQASKSKIPPTKTNVRQSTAREKPPARQVSPQKSYRQQDGNYDDRPTTSKAAYQERQGKTTAGRQHPNVDTAPSNFRTSQETFMQSTKYAEIASSPESGKSSGKTISEVSETDDEDIALYNKLTEKCTKRIDELNGLIKEVRDDKKRIIETSMSSSSGNQFLSSNYTTLPNEITPDTASGGGESDTSSKTKSSDSTTGHEIPSTTTSVPLEKHRPIGKSRDSGISLSRPLTALDQHPDTEPISQPSTSQATQSETTSHRKTKPPPSMRRYSPQLIEDDAHAHELSTILEVDTPGTSRITNTVQCSKVAPQPIAFPTFEQYARQHNLDLTKLDPDISIRIQEELNEIFTILKDARQNNKKLSIEDFPSLTSYLQNLTTDEQISVSHDKIEELLNDMRLSAIQIASFPSHREYMERNVSNFQQQLDSESLENLSASDSSSFNVIEEMKRRNIIKSPQRAMAFEQVASKKMNKKGEHNSSYLERMINVESGIEKISSSSSDHISSELERELSKLGMHWPQTMMKKKKETDALSDTSASSDTLREQGGQGTNRQKLTSRKKLEKKDKADQSSFDIGVPLNLRDFITKECLKHVSTSTNSSTISPDATLRSRFFSSIIGNLTPSNSSPNPSAEGDCAAVLSSNVPTTSIDRRHKTSTPHSLKSPTRTRSSSNPHSGLFSGESRISSVPYPESINDNNHSNKEQRDTKQKTNTQQYGRNEGRNH